MYTQQNNSDSFLHFKESVFSHIPCPQSLQIVLRDKDGHCAPLASVSETSSFDLVPSLQNLGPPPKHWCTHMHLAGGLSSRFHQVPHIHMAEWSGQATDLRPGISQTAPQRSDSAYLHPSHPWLTDESPKVSKGRNAHTMQLYHELLNFCKPQSPHR